MRVWGVAAALGVAFCAVISGRAQLVIKTDAQIKQEDTAARELYTQSKMVAALPLYEDLHAQRPRNVVYSAGLAMCLLGAATGMEPPQAKAAHARAKALLLEAQKGGDNSPLVQTVLEKMGDGDGYGAETEAAPPNSAMAYFKQAEKQFGEGNLAEAIVLYKKALGENPRFYEAALYTGDALFRSGDCNAAGEYYAKAIAIDTDREQAHRYWADCLAKQKQLDKARDQYILAVVAQPYQKTTRQQLDQWATLNGKVYAGPAIRLPAGPTAGGKPGDMTITLDPSGDSNAMMAGILYAGTRAGWRDKEFAKTYPNEKTYRHSLPEEAAAIRSMLSGGDVMDDKKKKKPDKPDPSMEMLRKLDKEGLLECWILMDNPDQGIAQDYVAYRAAHRDLLAQYIAQYDIHPK